MRATSLEQVAAWAGGRLLSSSALLAEGADAAARPGTAAAVDGGDGAVTAVVTDSRQASPGSLFVAIPGERVDGHTFLAQVAAAGATAALVSDLDAARAALARQGEVPAGAEATGPASASQPATDDGQAGADLPLIVVPDTVEALGRLAAGYLADLRQRATQRGSALTVLGITGSVGKTTTKDLTRQVLAAQGPTVAPVASFNNEIGLPLTVLEADESTRYLVLEMGASGPGHITYLTDIAPLDAAAVLMVGHAHMGGFGSIEGVARAKAEIIEGLLPTGTAVLNLDDARVAAMAHLAPGRVVTFSRQPFPADADAPTVHASRIHLDADAHPVIDLSLPGVAVSNLRLAVRGEHNVANALAAAALAYAVGVRPDTIVPALTRAGVESPHRLAVREVRRDLGGAREADLLVIDDSYNANIDSMTASLAALPALAGTRRRVVVISEMLELGESSRADHATTGELAARAGASLLVTIGAGAAPAAAAARAAGVEVIETSQANDAVDLLTGPDTPLRPGDAVLLKGSHGSGAWQVADALVAQAAPAPKEEHHS